MWHILAGHLSHTKEWLKTNMSAKEFEEWQVFYRIRPFGPWHEDYRFAHLCSVIYNSIGGIFGNKSRAPKEFMTVQPQPIKLSDPEVAAKVKAEMSSIFQDGK